MKNSEYWKLRFEQLEQAQNGQGAAAFAEIEKQYKEAQKQIEGQIARWYQRFADNNGITLAQARQYLKGAALKEFQWDVQDYFRYMDDIVIFGSSKEELHALKREIDVYFMRELRLTIKGNWQVFPSYVRGVDFVGYRTFLNYTLLRKSSCTNFKKKMVAIREKTASGQMMNYSEWCSVNSYKGWLKHCDSYRLRKKYIAPIQDDADRYYRDVVKTKKYERKAA